VTTGASPDDDPGMIERLDAGEPASSPEEAQARAPYERLLARIRDLDDIAPPAGWEDRAVARWSGARRKRRFVVALGTAAAAALAAVLLLQPCAAPTATWLEVAVSHPPGSTPRGDAVVGDSLHARARSDRAHLELRVYLETRLVARCPGSSSCRRDGAVLELDWKLGEAGTYQIILLSNTSDIPEGDGILDRDQLDAQGAGASIETRSLKVTP
jgi:hypothetical protein